MRKGYRAIMAMTVAMLAGTAASAATTFDFTLSAPLTNGDTATGSGTLTADEAFGGYVVTGVTGTLAFDADTPGQAITAVSGMGGMLPVFLMNFADTYWTQYAEFDTASRSLTLMGLGGNYVAMGVELFSRNAKLTITLQAPPVPEPATWALMVGGFGLAGAALRRRTRVQFAQA